MSGAIGWATQVLPSRGRLRFRSESKTPNNTIEFSSAHPFAFAYADRIPSQDGLSSCQK